MGKTTNIICDGCGKDITRTTNCEDYLLCLDNRSMPTVGGIVTAMGAYPVLERDYYVCSVRCLVKVVEPLREAVLREDAAREARKAARAKPSDSVTGMSGTAILS